MLLLLFICVCHELWFCLKYKCYINLLMTEGCKNATHKKNTIILLNRMNIFEHTYRSPHTQSVTIQDSKQGKNLKILSNCQLMSVNHLHLQQSLPQALFGSSNNASFHYHCLTCVTTQIQLHSMTSYNKSWESEF